MKPRDDRIGQTMKASDRRGGQAIVDRVERWQPAVVQLATVLSIAARAEPALVREARLRLLPGVPVSAEADLWFSPLVAFADSDGLVLRADVATVLRRRLARAPDRRQASRDLVEQFHSDSPPTLTAEDQILWLSALGGPREADAIGEILRQVATTIHSDAERSDDLLRWIVQALRRLPQSAVATDWAGYLASAAATRLRVAVPLNRPVTMDEVRRGRAMVEPPPVGRSETRSVGLACTRTGVLVSDPPTPDVVEVEVSEAWPLIVQVAPAGVPSRPKSFELRSETRQATPLTVIGTTPVGPLVAASPLESVSPARWGLAGTIVQWAWASDVGTLGIVDNDGQLSLADTTGDVVVPARLPSGAPVRAVAASGADFVVASDDDVVWRVRPDGRVEELWQARGPVAAVAVTLDGSHAAVGLRDGEVVQLGDDRVRSVTGIPTPSKRPDPLDSDDDELTAVLFGLSGGLVTVSRHGRVLWFDLGALEEHSGTTAFRPLPPVQKFRAAVADRDGERLALAGELDTWVLAPGSVPLALPADDVVSMTFVGERGPLLLLTSRGDLQSWRGGAATDLDWVGQLDRAVRLVDMGDSLAIASLGADASVTFSSGESFVIAATEPLTVPRSERAPARALRSERGWDDREWRRLVEMLRNGDCTPVLGPGTSSGTLPSDAELSRRLADSYAYPFGDPWSLPDVAQYAAVVEGDRHVVVSRFVAELQRYGEPDYSDPTEPHMLLARLPIPVYLTTNRDDFLTRALMRARKHPATATCAWHRGVEIGRSTKVTGGDRPHPEEPLVFHLHGQAGDPASVVLTSQDHVEFLANVAVDRGSDARRAIPIQVLAAITQRPLLLIGHDLRDRTFAMLLHGYISAAVDVHRRRHVSVQALPTVTAPADRERRRRMEDYVTTQYARLNTSVYWGSVRDFCAELTRRLEG